VHVEDVAEAALRALRLPGIEGKAFNLSLPTPPSWNEYHLYLSGWMPCEGTPILGRQ
jgi:nucleoside-diphosphate-sugar epimerase